MPEFVDRVSGEDTQTAILIVLEDGKPRHYKEIAKEARKSFPPLSRYYNDTRPGRDATRWETSVASNLSNLRKIGKVSKSGRLWFIPKESDNYPSTEDIIRDTQNELLAAQAAYHAERKQLSDEINVKLIDILRDESSDKQAAVHAAELLLKYYLQ